MCCDVLLWQEIFLKNFLVFVRNSAILVANVLHNNLDTVFIKKKRGLNMSLSISDKKQHDITFVRIMLKRIDLALQMRLIYDIIMLLQTSWGT
jgi:hypothetical protein